MPAAGTVERFVSLVEAGRGIEVLETFYAEHATMQENGHPPRVGRQALLAHERAAQAGVTALKATCVRPVPIAGDVSVVRWVFEYSTRAGKAVRFEELAWQRWDGELIVEERFFYDPAQFG